MIIKLLTLLSVIVLFNGCSTTKTEKVTAPLDKKPSLESVDVSAEEKEVIEEKEKKSGFRCLIDKIASGIS